MSMTPQEANAWHRIGKLTGEEMVSLANQWLSEGKYSDGLNGLFYLKNRSLPDTAPLFEQAMFELGIEPVSKQEAAEILIWHVLSQVVAGSLDPVKGVERLYWDVHHQLMQEIPDTEYTGDSLRLESIFCWLREVWDCRDGSRLSYYADLPREVAERKQIASILAEAKLRLQVQSAGQ
jgi:hypothetical protein